MRRVMLVFIDQAGTGTIETILSSKTIGVEFVSLLDTFMLTVSHTFSEQNREIKMKFTNSTDLLNVSQIVENLMEDYDDDVAYFLTTPAETPIAKPVTKSDDNITDIVIMKSTFDGHKYTVSEIIEHRVLSDISNS